MAFINTLPLYSRSDVKLFLLTKVKTQETNEIGDNELEWEEVEIMGIIQRKQNIEIDRSGSESQVAYFGMFEPNEFLLLKKNKFENYRIKYESDYETIILKIKSLDPNLFIRQNRNHIEMELEEDRQWK